MGSVEETVSLSHISEFVILSHGFADYMRDYEVLVAEYAGIERARDRLYQFIGCVSAVVQTAIDAEVYVKSLPTPQSESSMRPGDQGLETRFSWGARFSTSQFGIDLITDDELVEWQKILGIRMHKALIITEAFRIQLIFHDLDTKPFLPNQLYSQSDPLSPF